MHFAVVLDPAGHVLTTYLDGARAGQATERRRDCRADRQPVVRDGQPPVPRPLAGRRGAHASRAAARRPHLSDRAHRPAGGHDPQQRAVAPPDQPRGRGARPRSFRRPTSRDESPLASRLAHVPDITVETAVGTLPHLPPTIPATYRGNAKGPDVRVIWPSPDGQQPGRRSPAPTPSPARCRAPRSSRRPRSSSKMAVRTTTPPSRLAEAFPAERGRRSTATRRGATRRSSRTATSSSAAWRPPIPTTSSTTSGTRSVSRSRQGATAARGVGQPDDEAARARERSLPVGDRAGLREHDVRRGAAGELPPAR